MLFVPLFKDAVIHNQGLSHSLKIYIKYRRQRQRKTDSICTVQHPDETVMYSFRSLKVSLPPTLHLSRSEKACGLFYFTHFSLRPTFTFALQKTTNYSGVSGAMVLQHVFGGFAYTPHSVIKHY